MLLPTYLPMYGDMIKSRYKNKTRQMVFIGTYLLSVTPTGFP